MIILIDFRLKLHNIRDLNPQQPRLTAYRRLSRSFLFKSTHKRSRSVGFSELTGFMWNQFAHIHSVRPLAAVGFGPRLDSGSVIQPVGCEKVRGQCCHGDGDRARANERMSSGTRRCWRSVGSAEPAVIWSGSEGVSTAISRGTKQTVSESRQPTQNTHTTLKWIYNEHTLALRDFHTTYFYTTVLCFPMSLKYVFMLNVVTPQYCVKSVFLRCCLSFMNSHLWQNNPLWGTLCGFHSLGNKTVHRSPLNVTKPPFVNIWEIDS